MNAVLTVLVYPVAPSPRGHEYLLLRRAQSLGGFWQGVKGTVEPGESLDEAAVRELIKGTQFHPDGLISADFHYTYRPAKRKPTDSRIRQPVTEHVFLATLRAKLDPTLDFAENDAWAWFPFEDALRWLRWPENIEALRRCETLIKGPLSDHG